MEVSRWTQEPGENFVTLEVQLPGVGRQQRKLELSEDGRKLFIKAARPAGRRACLPQTAQLTRDGRHELFTKELVVPEGLDMDRAEVHHSRDGLEISAPWLRQTKAKADTRASSGHARGSQRGKASKEASTFRYIPPAPVVPRANLASSDGLEVVDEPWPEPTKLATAAEGWYDNRNVFQPY